MKAWPYAHNIFNRDSIRASVRGCAELPERTPNATGVIVEVLRCARSTPHAVMWDDGKTRDVFAFYAVVKFDNGEVFQVREKFLAPVVDEGRAVVSWADCAWTPYVGG